MHRRARHFSYKAVAGCALWLDGGRAGTMYDATTGGNPVAMDAEVLRWEDLSGNARHAKQTGGANTKARRKVGAASNEAIVADETGTAEGFNTLSNPANGVAATYLVALKTADSTYMTGYISASIYFDATATSASAPYSNAGTPTYRVNGAAVTATRTALKAAIGSAASIISSSDVNMSGANMSLLQYSGGGGYPFTGDLYLFACFTTAPSTSLLRRMESAIAHRLKFHCS